MTTRTFRFRLQSLEGGTTDDHQSVRIERLSEEGEWQPQVPGLETPPFRLHLIALLLCLRYHLVAEAHERRIPLKEVNADMDVAVSVDWDLEEIRAAFKMVLDPQALSPARDRADEQAIAAIRERMLHSPVPRNRPAGVPLRLEVAIQPESLGLGSAPPAGTAAAG